MNKDYKIYSLETYLEQDGRRYPAHLKLTSLGASIMGLELELPGGSRDLILGFAQPTDYLHHAGNLGACIGRVANRLSGPSYSIDGQNYAIDANEGANCLHGGAAGFDRQNFQLKEQGKNHICLTLHSADGASGFPGNLDLQLVYSLRGGKSLVLGLEYEAQSDQTTLCNLTNHSYFNLAGDRAGSLAEHYLTIAADYYTESTKELLPTGRILPLAGTPLDFRQSQELTQILEQTEFFQTTGGLDHNFVLAQTYQKEPRKAAELSYRELSLEVWTTQPGLQVYTANFLDAPAKAHATGEPYRYQPHSGICLETQAWPDAPHHENFPSILLRAGEVYRQSTYYIFKLAAEASTPAL